MVHPIEKAHKKTETGHIITEKDVILQKMAYGDKFKDIGNKVGENACKHLNDKNNSSVTNSCVSNTEISDENLGDSKPKQSQIPGLDPQLLARQRQAKNTERRIKARDQRDMSIHPVIKSNLPIVKAIIPTIEKSGSDCSFKPTCQIGNIFERDYDSEDSTSMSDILGDSDTNMFLGNFTPRDEAIQSLEFLSTLSRNEHEILEQREKERDFKHRATLLFQEPEIIEIFTQLLSKDKVNFSHFSKLVADIGTLMVMTGLSTIHNLCSEDIQKAIFEAVATSRTTDFAMSNFLYDKTSKMLDKICADNDRKLANRSQTQTQLSHASSASPVLLIKIKNIALNALIDSGATASVLCGNEALINKSKIREGKQQVVLANGSLINILGTSQLTIQVKTGFEVSENFLVLESTSFACLMGTDLVSKMGIILDGSKRILTVTGIPSNKMDPFIQDVSPTEALSHNCSWDLEPTQYLPLNRPTLSSEINQAPIVCAIAEAKKISSSTTGKSTNPVKKFNPRPMFIHKDTIGKQPYEHAKIDNLKERAQIFDKLRNEMKPHELKIHEPAYTLNEKLIFERITDEKELKDLEKYRPNISGESPQNISTVSMSKLNINNLPTLNSLEELSLHVPQDDIHLNSLKIYDEDDYIQEVLSSLNESDRIFWEKFIPEFKSTEGLENFLPRAENISNINIKEPSILDDWDGLTTKFNTTTRQWELIEYILPSEITDPDDIFWHKNTARLRRLRVENFNPEEVYVNPDLKPETKAKIREVLIEFADAFASDASFVGTAAGIKVKLKLKTPNITIKQTPYSVSIQEQDIIDKLVSETIRSGYVRRGNSTTCSPVILVSKKTDICDKKTKSDAVPVVQYRMVIDYRALNKHLENVGYPLARIDVTLANLAHAQYFITSDVRSAFNCIAMDKESQEICAFVTHNGVFIPSTLQFGLISSAAEYSYAMSEIFAEMLKMRITPEGRQYQMQFYIDDIMVKLQREECIPDALRDMLATAQKRNISYKASKTTVGGISVNTLGWICDRNGIYPDESRIQGILRYRRPTCIRELRSFVGSCGFFRSCLKDSGGKIGVMSKLLKNNVKFVWTDEMNDAFLSLLADLSRLPLLRFPPPHPDPLFCFSDASLSGVGGFVAAEIVELRGSTKSILERLYPLGFYSRALLTSEQNKPSVVLELNAACYILNKARMMAFGRLVYFYSDCKFMSYLNGSKSTSQAIIRQLMFLQNQNCKWIYLAGRFNLMSDALSRMCLGDTTQEERDKEAVDEEFLKISYANTLTHTSNAVTRSPSRKESYNMEAYIRRINTFFFTDINQQLETIGLQSQPVESDGNCFYRAVSYLLYGTEHKHKKLRALTCDYIEQHFDTFLPYFYEPNQKKKLTTFIANQRITGLESKHWANNISVSAISLLFKAKIIFHKHNAVPIIEQPHGVDLQHIWNIDYIQNEHYNATKRFQVPKPKTPPKQKHAEINKYRKAKSIVTEKIVPSKITPVQRYDTEEITFSSKHVAKDLALSQRRDPKYADTWEVLSDFRTTSDNFCIRDGLLVKLRNDRELIVVTEEMLPLFLKYSHDTRGHQSFDRGLSEFRSKYYYPDIQEALKTYIKSCKFCIDYKVPRRLKYGLLGHLEVTEKMHTWSIDSIGPMATEEEDDEQYLLIAADLFSGFIVVHPVHHLNSATLSEFIINRIAMAFKIPVFVTADNASYLKSKNLQAACNTLGIAFRYTSVSHQSSNYVERKIAEYNKVMASFCHANSTTWKRYIYLAAKTLNDLQSKSSKMSPTEIIYNFKPETVLDRLINIPQNSVLRRQREEIENKVKDVLARVKKSRENYKMHADKKRLNVSFEVGQQVAIEDIPKPSLKHNVRYMVKYSSPWLIMQKLSPINYMVQWNGPEINDKRTRKGGDAFLIHIDKMKEYEPRQ